MSLRSLMYVSASQLSEDVSDDETRAIVESSSRNNFAAGISGALLSSGRYFAQVLEGPQIAVGALLDVIGHDPRHHGMKILNDKLVDRRKFGQWQMAYVGPSVFVDRQIRRLLANPTDGEIARMTDWIESILVEHDKVA